MTVQEQRAYVESRIPEALLEDHRQCCGEEAPFRVRFVGTSESTGWTDTEDEAWTCAYQRVVAREEEIRELGEEVYQMADHAHMALQRVCDLIDDGDDGESLVIYVRDVCEYTRTWERLTAILEEKKVGWKI